MSFNLLIGKCQFILFYILLIAHSSMAHDSVTNESSSKVLTPPEITTWETDLTSNYGQFIKSSANDNTKEILVWKTSESQGYVIKNISVIQNSVYLTYWQSNSVVCINLDSLTQKSLRVSEELLYRSIEPFVAYDDVKDKILLSTSKWVRIFEQSSLKLEKNLGVSLDCRIRPILLEDNLVFVEGYRGESIVRIDLNANIVWKCKLPGYVMSNPVVYGSIMIIQTRQGSYGGQATTAINLTNGKILWSETTDAYGGGVCFGDDAYLCFESDLYLDPQKTEGWIICRTPDTGKRKWRHIQRGAIEHRPVFDQKSNNLYAVFSEFVDTTRSGGENEVICLKADTGSIRWKSKLATAVKKAPASSYEQYWSALRLQNNMLMVLDEKDVLHFFNPENGNLILRLDLDPIKQICSVPRRKTEIINMPMIIKDKLLVFTNHGFVLCPIK